MEDKMMQQKWGLQRQGQERDEQRMKTKKYGSAIEWVNKQWEGTERECTTSGMKGNNAPQIEQELTNQICDMKNNWLSVIEREEMERKLLALMKWEKIKRNK